MESIINFGQNIAFKLSKYIKIPETVAVIMDGNRRFAKTKKIEKIKGHTEGYYTLINFCDWSLKLGVKKIIAYAFSIDNFNRSEEEINGLMSLIKDQFAKLSEKDNFLMQNGIKVIFIGNKSFLTKEIVEITDKIERNTAENTK